MSNLAAFSLPKKSLRGFATPGDDPPARTRVDRWRNQHGFWAQIAVYSLGCKKCYSETWMVSSSSSIEFYSRERVLSKKILNFEVWSVQLATIFSASNLSGSKKKNRNENSLVPVLWRYLSWPHTTNMSLHNQLPSLPYQISQENEERYPNPTPSCGSFIQLSRWCF